MSGEEDAFLASMTNANNAPDPDQAHVDEQEDDEYDPTHNEAPAGDEALAIETAQPSEAAASSNGLAVPSHSVSRANSHSPNPVSAPKKQVTIGGFVAEDSDEEAERADASASLQTSSQSIAVENVKTPLQAQTDAVPVSSVVQTLLPASQDLSSSAAPTPVNGVSNTVPSAPAPVAISAAATVASGLRSGDAADTHPQAPSDAVSLPKSRLPNDIIGQLEDRIADDPRGDVDAWLGLISHLKSRGKYEEVRKVYGRLFEVFPSAADQWISYARMELELDDLPRLEAIFNLSLLKIQSIEMWNIYIDHVRRRNDLATDASGQGRQVVTQAYEFVINQVGQDKDSGQLWQDYISFLKSGPGTAGGTGWQDAQKMDLLRKAYQRAVCVPMSAVSTLWKEYDTFEMGLNKMTGRKFLQEKSPSYMTARSSYTALQNITRSIRRGIMPRLPPHPGCDGEEDYNAQVAAWSKWIDWEKEDPLVLKEEDPKALQSRVLFAYRQATMALRFYPCIWFEASQWCSSSGLDTEASSFLDQGIEANPESCLLAFKKADSIESTTSADEAEEAMVKRGKQVRAPYDGVLNALYKHIDSIIAREKLEIGRIEERYAALSPDSREGSQEPAPQAEEEEEVDISKPLTKKQLKEKEIEDLKAHMLSRVRLTSKTLTYVWIALMRAMRRIQRKGKPGEAVGGMRGIFKEARVRGRLVSDFHIASALMEHHCYHDPAASKIFNLGMRLFPEDENFALAHVQFLISTGDLTNARAVFETTVSKITANPKTAPRAKMLFAYFHDWESKYGELSQASKIEKRMAELYPEESALELFSQRFGSALIGPPPFDPCTVNLVLSPSQVRPKNEVQTILPSIETAEVASLPQLGYVQSPKRPLDDSEAELPARKLIRGESPLKGAAGRRQQQRQAREGLLTIAAPSGPRPLPPAVQSLLSIIPPARQWDQSRFEPFKMVDLIRSVDMTKARMPSNVGPQYGR